MPRIDSNTNTNQEGAKRARRRVKPKPKTKKYVLPNQSTPRGDAPATRKEDFAKAEAHKQTPSYKKALYKSQPVAKRRERIAAIEAKPVSKRTAEDKAVLQTHRRRAARDKKVMASKIFSDRQRELVEDHKASYSYSDALADARKERKENIEEIDYINETDPEKLKAAGFKPAGTLDKIAAAPGNLIGSGAAIAAATYHDPVGVPAKTAKQALLAVPATIGAVPELVMHPKKTVEEGVKSYTERTGQTVAEKIKRIRKEGAFEDAADLAIAVAPASGAARGLARAGGAKASPRAGLRVSGGTVRRREQDGGLIGQTVRGKLDNRRAKKLEKKLKEAEDGGKPISALDRQAALANREAGRTVEVTPRLTIRSTRAQKREGVAKPRGRAVYGLKSDQGRRLGADRKAINRLSKAEQRAFFYATQGIRTPEQAIELLPSLRKKIEYYRTANGIKVQGRLKKADMLPDIEKILADPKGHFTENLAKVIEELTPDALRAGLEDPGLTPETIARRRHAVQAELLDIERGVENQKPNDPLSGSVTTATSKAGDGDFMGDADLEATWSELKGEPDSIDLKVREVEDGRRVSVEKFDGDGKLVGRLVFDAADDGIPRNVDVVVHSTQRRKGIATKLYDRARAEGFDMRSAVTERRSPDGAAFREAYAPRKPDPEDQRLLQRYQDLIQQDRPTEADWSEAAKIKDRLVERGVWPKETDRRAREIVPGSHLATAVAKIANGEAPGQNGVPPLRYRGDETDLDHAKRVAAEAEAKGLGTPLYFKSERYPGLRDFAAHAVGVKGMSTDPRYKGTNLLSGLQDTSPETFLRGKARNIKRKHNWQLNKEILDKNALRAFSRPGGEKLSVVVARLAEAGVDQNSVGFVDRNIFDRAMRDPGPEDPAGAARFADAEEFEQAAISKALSDSIVKVEHLTEGKLAHSSRWEVVPIAVLREMEAQTNSGIMPAVGRSADIIKGKMSRAILGTGNVPWQLFNLVSDAMMATVVTGGRAANPANWLGAARWWNQDLTPTDRDRVGAMLGLDATGADSKQVKLGASTSNDLVNTYRALKAHPFWHTPLPAVKIGAHLPRIERGPTLSESLNPLEWMFMVDRKRSNATRILAGFSKQKREAVHRMGESMGRAERAQLKITSILAKPPAEQMRMLSRDREVLEEHADAIAEWMGDYTTMTAAERKIVNRWVMFYPYMRYSLRLMFYTLPVKHPAVAAVLAELGALRVDELRELFGYDEHERVLRKQITKLQTRLGRMKEGSEAYKKVQKQIEGLNKELSAAEVSLFWNLGKVYVGKDGNSIDLKRAHPALNALWDAAGATATQDRSPSQLAGLLPPWAGMMYDQVTGKSYFSGKDLRIQGKAASYGQQIPTGALDVRARILIDDALSLTYAYRTAETLTQTGVHGDDSLLWSPRPTTFRGDDTASKLQRKFGKRNEAFEAEQESLLRELIPMLPEPNRDVERERERRLVAKAERPAGPSKSKAKGYGFGDKSSGYKFGDG